MITNGPTTNGPDTRGSDGRSLDGDAWRSESICRKHPTRWWFGGDQRETAVARGICATCGVQSACLEFAIGRPEMLGIWAATTPADRAAIRRARSAPPVETEPDAPATVAAIRVAGDNGVAIGDAVEVIAVDVAAAEVAARSFGRDVSAAAVASAGASRRRHGARSRRGPRPRSRARARHRVPALEPTRLPQVVRHAARAGDRRGVRRRPSSTNCSLPRRRPASSVSRPNTVTRWSRAGRISAIQTIGGHRRFRRTRDRTRCCAKPNLAGPLSSC